MAQERTAALCGAAYGVLEAMAVFSGTHNVAAGSMLSVWTLSLGIASGVAGDFGGDAFVNRQIRHTRTWIAVVVFSVSAQVCMAALPPLDACRRQMYGACLTVLLWLPVVFFARPLRTEFGRLGKLALVPTGLSALSMTVLTLRSAVHVGAGLGPGTPLANEAPRLTPVVASTGVFQLVWFALVLSRQILAARKLATHDALTGLLLRPALHVELASAHALARRYGQVFSVAFIDIDRFKRVNGVGGHGAGDAVLRDLARLLLGSARDTDRVGRWGGEELDMVMPNTDATGAHRLLERLQASLRQAGVSVPRGCVPLSVSIGCATAGTGEASCHELVARADAAMYRAKSRGGYTTVQASP